MSTIIIIADGAWFVKGFFMFSGVFLLFFGTWAESPRETGGADARSNYGRLRPDGGAHRVRTPRTSARARIRLDEGKAGKTGAGQADFGVRGVLCADAPPGHTLYREWAARRRAWAGAGGGNVRPRGGAA